MSQRFTSRSTNAISNGLPTATYLEQKSLEVVDARGVKGKCDFKVQRDGHWFIFDGKVDSQSTKSELFALVPKVDGALWIVDRLRTEGSPGRRVRAGRKGRSHV